MSIDWERSTHPDLIEEEAAAREQVDQPPPQEKPARGRKSSRNSARTEAAAPGETPSPAAEGAGGGETVVASPAEPPSESPQSGDDKVDWQSAVREATDPQTAFSAILKHTPLEELQKDPRIAGWLGDMAQKRARAIQQQQAQEEAAKAKQDAWQRGDYYRLGELSASEQEAQAILAQQQAASAPFMQSVEQFQRSLPDKVQEQIQGKNYASVAEYMQAAVLAARDYEVQQQVEAELKKRAPALQKAELSATVGREQTPERDSGPTPGVREITDAEIERMSLAEYDRYFDENGKPKGGVRLRITRGIDVSRR